MLEISVYTLTCYPLDYVVCQIQNKSNQIKKIQDTTNLFSKRLPVTYTNHSEKYMNTSVYTIYIHTHTEYIQTTNPHLQIISVKSFFPLLPGFLKITG